MWLAPRGGGHRNHSSIPRRFQTVPVGPGSHESAGSDLEMAEAGCRRERAGRRQPVLGVEGRQFLDRGWRITRVDRFERGGQDDDPEAAGQHHETHDGSLEVDGTLSALIELGAGFHPDLTGRENVFLNGNILGLSRREVASKFDEIVDFSELHQFIDTPVKRYSSGMVVRLGFAVASCIEPEILLVDEVLAVGDASFQEKCMQRIRISPQERERASCSCRTISISCRLSAIARSISSTGDSRHPARHETSLRLYEQDLHLRRAQRLDQPAARRDAESASIEITRVDVTGAPAASPALHNDQPAEIRIHYTAYRPLGPVHVSVFVKRSDGLTCCMMRTRLDEFELRLDRGSGVVSLVSRAIAAHHGQLLCGSVVPERQRLDGYRSGARTLRLVHGEGRGSQLCGGQWCVRTEYALEPPAGEPAVRRRGASLAPSVASARAPACGCRGTPRESDSFAATVPDTGSALVLDAAHHSSPLPAVRARMAVGGVPACGTGGHLHRGLHSSRAGGYGRRPVSHILLCRHRSLDSGGVVTDGHVAGARGEHDAWWARSTFPEPCCQSPSCSLA